MKTLLKTILFFAAAIPAGAQSLQEALKLTENERYAMANGVYKKLVESVNNNGDYYFYYGDNYFKAGDLDSARILFEKGDAINASNPICKVGIGKVNLYTGKNLEATKSFSDAKMLVQTQAKQMSGPKQAVIYCKIAEAHIHGPTKNLDEALALLAMAEKQDPKNPEIFLLRGDALIQKDAMSGSKAIEQYEKARTLNPKLCMVDYRIGVLWINAKNLQLAVESFDKAIACDPTFAPAYRGKAEALYRAGRNRGGVENYEKYLELNAGDPDAMTRYASFLYLVGQYKSADSVIQVVQRKDSSSVVLYRIAGYCQYEQKLYESALKNMNSFFRKAEAKGKPRIEPSDYTYRGRSLSKLKKDSLGLLDIKKAYDMDTTQKDLFSDMGQMSYNMKKYADCEQYYLKKYKSGAKMTVNDWNQLGRAYYAIDRFGAADSAFMKVCELRPDITLGFVWRAKSNVGLDPNNKQGLARPHFEKVVDMASADKVANKKELIEAYGNLGIYHYNTNNLGCAKAYMNALIELDPGNAKAKQVLDFENVKKATAADITTCKLPAN
ncbi:MAG: hypothetical protein FD123_308 [Bacteroidetes bacterium]|nr:MAG: hypothetical protein FD123_308 [Bacteroidota bacterium]